MSVYIDGTGPWRDEAQYEQWIRSRPRRLSWAKRLRAWLCGCEPR